MVFVILGMHKSGTTLISQILHKSGINMGNFDETIGYDEGNQYERKETLELNMEMLGCSYADFSVTVVNTIKKENLSKKIELKIINLIQKLCKQYKDWGFKDPRTCLTYSVWKNYLPEHRIIGIFRHPQEVVHHYLRSIPSYNFILKLKRSYMVLKAWCTYNKNLINYVSIQPERSIVLEFSNFMSSQETFSCLENFVGKRFIDSRKLSLYRAQRKKDIFYIFAKFLVFHLLSFDVEELYKHLNKLSTNLTSKEKH